MWLWLSFSDECEIKNVYIYNQTSLIIVIYVIPPVEFHGNKFGWVRQLCSLSMSQQFLFFFVFLFYSCCGMPLKMIYAIIKHFPFLCGMFHIRWLTYADCHLPILAWSGVTRMTVTCLTEVACDTNHQWTTRHQRRAFAHTGDYWQLPTAKLLSCDTSAWHVPPKVVLCHVTDNHVYLRTSIHLSGPLRWDAHFRKKWQNCIWKNLFSRPSVKVLRK